LLRFGVNGTPDVE
jgi:hypothetical protein